MTIDREYFDGPIVVHCDGKRCAEVIETRCTDFTSAIAKIKARGWRVVKVSEGGEGWEHLCPDEEN